MGERNHMLYAIYDDNETLVFIGTQLECREYLGGIPRRTFFWHTKYEKLWRKKYFVARLDWEHELGRKVKKREN